MFVLRCNPGAGPDNFICLPGLALKRPIQSQFKAGFKSGRVQDGGGQGRKTSEFGPKGTL